MKMHEKNKVIAHFDNVLHHLYINPLEKCNLACKICYTRKTAPILSEKQILDFVERYNREIEVKVITFCGGEVFALSYFSHLVNVLTARGIFIQIITNGTIDKLDQFDDPNKVNLIVSLDGLEEYHDKNRGKGNFKKSTAFLSKAKVAGFHTEVFSIVTRQNFAQLDAFESFLERELGIIEVTYHPRKPFSYLDMHPVSNIKGEEKGFDFLTKEELGKLMLTKKTFPPRELGCYQISLASDGSVYGCCEGFDKIGNINTLITHLIDVFRKRIKGPCLGCSQVGFMCGGTPSDYIKNHDCFS
jgi:MoaA/NifB/PqqE/SkfB family radical SAM enzyme